MGGFRRGMLWFTAASSCTQDIGVLQQMYDRDTGYSVFSISQELKEGCDLAGVTDGS